MSRRVGTAGLVGLIVLSTFTGGTEREAGACSCGGPATAVISPDRADDAPLNTKVRIEIPSFGPSSGGSGGGAGAGTIVLRVHGTGRQVPTTTRTVPLGGWLTLVELTPTAPLDASTQYEIAMIDPAAFPPATVIGTFRTGTTADTTPPHLDSVGAPVAFKNTRAMSAACQVPGPWVNIDGVHAADPGRPDAQLVYGVWLGDAAGKIDSKKPPTAVMAPVDVEHLQLGQSSVCDPRRFPIPTGPVMWLGIAAIDEAGNTSVMQRVRVDLAGARQP